jgi:chromosomal replication initiator protein
MYLCRELTDASFPEIGRLFGGKDHTTIMHACRQIMKAKEGDNTLNQTLDGLREKVLRS